MKTVKIVGNHSVEHCGCAAVMDALNNLIKQKYKIIQKDNEDYDYLIVNGEGSMHHGRKNYVSKMEEIKKAQIQEKKTYLINTVWQENPNIYDTYLNNICHIVVREGKSQHDLLLNHKTNSTVRLDISIMADINETETFVDLEGSLAATDFYSKEFGAWLKYTAGGFAKQPYLDMKKLNWSQFVLSIKTSSFLITGRHHAVYAACKAKTPFIALESNSHKISGLIEMSNIPIPVCSKPNELYKTLSWAKKNNNAYLEFFDFVQNYKKLSLEDLNL